MEFGSRSFHDVDVASPSGRIDHNTAEKFLALLTSQAEESAESGHKVVLDLSGVEYMSSVGLRALMIIAKKCKETETAIVVAGMRPDMKEIFEISRFNFVYDAFDTVSEAISQFSEAAATAFEDA